MSGGGGKDLVGADWQKQYPDAQNRSIGRGCEEQRQTREGRGVKDILLGLWCKKRARIYVFLKKREEGGGEGPKEKKKLNRPYEKRERPRSKASKEA